MEDCSVRALRFISSVPGGMEKGSAILYSHYGSNEAIRKTRRFCIQYVDRSAIRQLFHLNDWWWTTALPPKGTGLVPIYSLGVAST
jgi:hypothetical protein